MKILAPILFTFLPILTSINPVLSENTVYDRRAHRSVQNYGHPSPAAHTIHRTHRALQGYQDIPGRHPFCLCRAQHRLPAPLTAVRPTIGHSNQSQQQKRQDVALQAYVLPDGISSRPPE